MIKLMETPMLAQQLRRAAGDLGDVVYVHGPTFGADLSVLFAFDGRSWADELNDAGFNVWGFDFAGYGASQRCPQDDAIPAGRLHDVQAQLHRVVRAVRERNGGRPVMLLAHSWGGSVAARYAGGHPQELSALVLFAPIVMRSAATVAGALRPGAHRRADAAGARRVGQRMLRGRCRPLADDTGRQRRGLQDHPACHAPDASGVVAWAALQCRQ
ncbi:alpha/beta hydrolase fold protein [Janthinobacterium sp. HH01]|uniref:alpha/beta hydrolase n=1 Tax=Janthinobacterium sp. HH01 TaxID=1198452 RepID=UPI0002AEAE13|nr:alpha/beta fold hydrolase [Janthinobacterium sp. HH01]ELX09765.1 alpha/beta hydrolase fold protein [Janthinobacterium sp. HH01]